LQAGDLIFLESSVSDVENSIQGVTSSIGDYNFTHVGIVHIDSDDNIYVLEATPPKVKMTPLEDYLYPNDVDSKYPRAVVGRLKPEYWPLIPAAIEEGMKLFGRNYDYAYTLNDADYYCSEYIFDILKKANGGEDVFLLNEMTFKSSETGEITEGWLRYFEKLGVEVPEGQPGINPGAMSRSEVIDIVHFYESPANN